MEFTYIADTDQQLVKNFLKRQHVSKKLLAKIKFAGGEILVNGKEENAIFRLSVGDEVKITVADEAANPDLLPEDFPVDVVYEDEDYLIINKPAGFASITGTNSPTGSMCNFAAGYVRKNNYANQKIHLATRLDRDTSGLMIFAKHSFAHSILRAQKTEFTKKYFALVNDDGRLPSSGTIDAPIGRNEGSIIERRVRFDGLMEAKAAQTSYQVIDSKNALALLDLTLHTGRTHQIRVHMAYLGYPLLGDDLYGGDCSLMERQALHCYSVKFYNAFRQKEVFVEIDLPEDMKKVF